MYGIRGVTTRDMVREFGASPNTLKVITALVDKGLLVPLHLVQIALIPFEWNGGCLHFCAKYCQAPPKSKPSSDSTESGTSTHKIIGKVVSVDLLSLTCRLRVLLRGTPPGFLR